MWAEWSGAGESDAPLGLPELDLAGPLIASPQSIAPDAVAPKSESSNGSYVEQPRHQTVMRAVSARVARTRIGERRDMWLNDDSGEPSPP